MRDEMDIKELIQNCQLSEAREQVVEGLKKNPADMGLRTTLMQILCFLQEWDKAEKHLDILLSQDEAIRGGVQQYKTLLQAEKERERVAEFAKLPIFLPKSSASAEKCSQARDLYVADNKAESLEVLEQLRQELAQLNGTINGEPFSGFEDVDSFLGGFLEAVVYDQYVWIPFTAIREIIIEPPTSLGDLFWISANITTWDDLSINAFLPVVYPGNSEQDGQVQMGRITKWNIVDDSFLKGAGQHLYTCGDNDFGILEIRELIFNYRPTEADNGTNN
jgi:type VI secretion system protein ImpE